MSLPGGPVPRPQRRRTFFHPLSGLVILGVDWLAFGIELPTKLLLTPVVSLVAFAAVFLAVARIQRRDGDGPKRAGLKALLGALAAGVPFPVVGTIVGAVILALSGLRGLPFRRM